MQGPNLVLWITCLLPAAAVLGSAVTIGAAVLNPDSELPEQYHWEGLRLDRDFSLAQRASELRVHAGLEVASRLQRCNLTLSALSPPPSSLSLALTHATRPALDRRIELRRIAGDSGTAASGQARYIAACDDLPAAHWRLELSDAENGWTVRGEAWGSLADVTLAASRGQESGG